MTVKSDIRSKSANPFVHLHVHSNYSLLSGANRIAEIITAAALYKMDSIALTDTNAMYGIIPFYQAAKAAEIKPILGAEIDIEGISAVLLARNNHGYSSLCRIVTLRQLDDEFPMPHNPKLLKELLEDNDLVINEVPNITHSEIDNYGGNYDCDNLSYQRREPVGNFSAFETRNPPLDCMQKARAVEKMRQWLEPEAENLVVITQDEAVIRNLVGAVSNLYVELCNFGGYESRKKIEHLREIARELRVPCVASNAVRFVSPEGHFRHRLLTAIRLNTTLEALLKDDVANPQCWLKPYTDMRKLFEDMPDALRNARRIADMCNAEIELGKVRLPDFPVPKGMTADSYLRMICMKGARKRYGRISPEVQSRINYELSVISKTGFAAYFLVVWDIARFAFKNGIPSVGRGSAANSIVSYCLGLTHVCPIRYNLFFERFLNLERKDCPDVDLDFCWKRRDRVLEYVYERYGRDHVAMICTFNTMAMRSSIREVAKVHGLLNDEISAFTKRLPYYNFGTVDKAVEELPECRDLPVHDEPWKTILRLAGEIADYPRHLGVHPGGIVVSPCPITCLVPLQYTAKGIVITQYSMNPVEDIGLVKIDLLGQRSLSVIADVVELLEKRDKIHLQMTRLEEGDGKTIEMWKSAKTIGCFQVESPSMRGLLKKLKVDNIGILTAASSIVRPGPSDGGMTKKFIDRYNKKEEVVYLHPKLEKILGGTLGVMVYQEDVIKVVHELAGIGFGEAEMLRKSMSKKRGIEAVASYKQRFIEGAVKNGIPQKTAREIWQQIASFAGYSFCKAHSASYAQVSYQVTFLKAHFPAEFMAAVIANGGGFYNTAVYLNEARRLGVQILPPDVNESGKDSVGESGRMRIGLRSVRDLTSRSIEKILECRAKRRFESFHDFCIRTGIGRVEIENLVRCGAFDSFGKTRPQHLWEVEMLFGNGIRHVASNSRNGARKDNLMLRETPDLFYDFRQEIPAGAPARLHDYDLMQKISDEIHILGFAVTAHPITPYLRKIEETGAVPIGELSHYSGAKVKIAGMLVTTRRAKTIKGEYMQFITLEDATGTAESVMFPKVYKEYGGCITSLGPYLVTGTVEDEYSHLTIKVVKIKSL